MGTTSKIKSIQKLDTSWDGRNGTMYDYAIALEDGVEGTASSTSPEKPPYAEGDEIEYTSTTNTWGTKLKIKKAGTMFGGGGNGGRNDVETQRRISASWAIGHAITQSENPEEIMEIAEHLLKMRDALISKL